MLSQSGIHRRQTHHTTPALISAIPEPKSCSLKLRPHQFRRQRNTVQTSNAPWTKEGYCNKTIFNRQTLFQIRGLRPANIIPLKDLAIKECQCTSEASPTVAYQQH